ncbi:hypothetical protein MKK75_29835 [Methylobacterium sp. J-030]|uniref:hypothetical protein n=1 Tax=Methylobacterium sp. J-030 TaxID=2836627 RepID=UPI001FB871DA|nr:hypothetical protein [Methylobacterium sp. J-030]MCJ2072946.1 hypothetical protein [Methylobacterium sp. J-030]
MPGIRGCGPDARMILPGLATVIGPMAAEARRRQDALWDRVPREDSRARLAGTLRLDLDKTLPDPLPLPPDANHDDVAGHGRARPARGAAGAPVPAGAGGGVGHRIAAAPRR